MSHEQDIRKGLLLALLGFASLSIGDGIMKSLAGSWPGLAAAALRYSFGAIGLGAFLLATGKAHQLKLVAGRIQLLRGLAVAVATASFFSSIFLMPLATATAIQFVSPMLTALLSAIFLKERIRRETLIATAIAFTGVIVVLRPNFLELGWPAALPVLAALGMAVLMIGNRLAAEKGGVVQNQFHGAWIAALALIAMAAVGHFVGLATGEDAIVIEQPDWTIVARCALVAFTATVSHLMVYLATTRASAATVAPMVYVQLLMALAIGILFYGDWPDALSIVGSAMIIGAGLWIWSGQRARGSKRLQVPETPD